MTTECVFSGHQPNILPYMGFFYKMFQSDVFVLDDDVQYSSKGLHNSNFLRVNNSKYRFTIPVSYNHGEEICQVKINYSREWREALYKTLENSYRKAKYFDEAYEMVRFHLDDTKENLVDLSVPLIKEIAERFCINSKIVIASKDVPTGLSKNERNIFQCKALGGTVYYSGSGGREYNDEQAYAANGIKLEYTDYEPVKYRQTGWGFIENLSVLDYVMNEGFVVPEGWRKKYA